ncbi:uncharacterized protein PITG_05228 [Phytophthora infestans T30-4]|uniref:Uncharacterized protein n=2 Tax=Phytophthora infestans TaxID=4787 RepID=D0N3V0_PHYIT|nr:uncharacterized protein PITG_05228 [Phytophthora infestans T30-4]EEY69054.1 hypothetical protein PITG_05228 [Phytophthora infestans T30-4]KAF4030782.1 hypothetical protein GN244_ATG17410 [Phytophthora infestans]KAF4129551.1 hypothetical protein GN958_ATG21258 [Phytophthora infestans]|eukprot:XP_002998908.1 hypothetical protein PITG_05228 [Phytophthora infestans T30-4]
MLSDVTRQQAIHAKCLTAYSQIFHVSQRCRTVCGRDVCPARLTFGSKRLCRHDTRLASGAKLLRHHDAHLASRVEWLRHYVVPRAYRVQHLPPTPFNVIGQAGTLPVLPTTLLRPGRPWG